MSDDKFGGIAWIGDSIGDALDLDVRATKLDAESFFQQKGILIVKVGNEDRPASEQDIKDVQECLGLAFKHWPVIPFTIVTHHAMDFSTIPIEDLVKVVKAVEGKDHEDSTGFCQQ